MNNAYQKDIKEILKYYKTSEEGLKSKDIKKRLDIYGKNVLIEKKPKSKWKLFASQFKNLMVFLLLIVGVMSLIYAIFTNGDYLEPIIILVATFINCIMGYLQESKAEEAVANLKKYESSKTFVKRDNNIYEIDAINLVKGDYIVLEAGDKIPADARIIKSYLAKTDESILTGESLSCDKNNQTYKEELPLSQRHNMIYSGTILVTGKIEAIVTEIGMDTELGKIASKLNNEDESITPLQVKVKKVSNFISFIAAILVTIVLCYGLIKDYSILNVIMLCISMIVASVPECLPIAITATLSIGVSAMSKKKTIVRNMAAIETLGATDIICTDKTGTLTTNQMEVVKIYTNNNYINIRDIKKNNILKEIINKCNNAHLKNGKYCGDAVDVALMNVIKKYKCIDTSTYEKIEVPFDSNRKLMSVIDKKVMYTKGSLESLLNVCKYIKIDDEIIKLNKKDKNNLLEIENSMSSEALKVIGCAYKEIDKINIKEEDYIKEEKDLIFAGLIGLKDPARKNVNSSIETCKSAGIRPIMITGDNIITAYSIAKEVGICENESECINALELKDLSDYEFREIVANYNVFARVSPEDKVRIVTALESMGKVVAMTGDGVNDAPAIKLAHVGIGMGKSGTDVTKDVADIILLDDSYKTITLAIEEGRRIYDNVITNILYNLSSNFTEILILLFGMFSGNAIIAAIHVLYIDLVADTIPSIALAFEKSSKDIMKRKPNGLNKRIFTPFFLSFLTTSVIIETIISLIVYFLFINLGTSVAQSLALFSIVLNEFVFAYNCRSLKEPIIYRGILSNKYLNYGILALFVFQIFMFLTPLGRLFGLEVISISSLVFVVFINIISFILIELLKPILVRLFKDE